jgi:hypothetical protein
MSENLLYSQVFGGVIWQVTVIYICQRQEKPMNFTRSYPQYRKNCVIIPAAIAHELSVDLKTKPVYFHQAFYSRYGGAIIIITPLSVCDVKCPFTLLPGNLEKWGDFPEKFT